MKVKWVGRNETYRIEESLFSRGAQDWIYDLEKHQIVDTITGQVVSLSDKERYIWLNSNFYRDTGVHIPWMNNCLCTACMKKR